MDFLNIYKYIKNRNLGTGMKKPSKLKEKRAHHFPQI